MDQNVQPAQSVVRVLHDRASALSGGEVALEAWGWSVPVGDFAGEITGGVRLPEVMDRHCCASVGKRTNNGAPDAVAACTRDQRALPAQSHAKLPFPTRLHFGTSRMMVFRKRLR
jgi:hypothetical protein